MNAAPNFSVKAALSSAIVETRRDAMKLTPDAICLLSIFDLAGRSFPGREVVEKIFFDFGLERRALLFEIGN